MRNSRRSYPPAPVYRAVLALRRLGRRVENYDRDRRLHVVDNAIVEESALLAQAVTVPSAGSRRRRAA